MTFKSLRVIRNDMLLFPIIDKFTTHITYFWFFPYYCLGVKNEFPALDVTVSKQNNSDCITVELGLFPTEKKKTIYVTQKFQPFTFFIEFLQ